MTFRQYVLRSGARMTTGWIETEKPLRMLQRLTTREHGPTIVWTVVRVGRIILRDRPVQCWRVGGLV